MENTKFEKNLHGQENSKLNLRKLWQTAMGTLALCAVLAPVSASGQAVMPPGSGIYLYSGGMAYAVVGYSIVDSHVFDPDSVQVGEIDDQGNIWDEQYTVIIGYTGVY